MGSSNSAGGKEYGRVPSTGVEAALYRRKSEVGSEKMGCEYGMLWTSSH